MGNEHGRKLGSDIDRREVWWKAVRVGDAFESIVDDVATRLGILNRGWTDADAHLDLPALIDAPA
jgi:hypothetical protein